jgi:hypothetical protein
MFMKTWGTTVTMTNSTISNDEDPRVDIGAVETAFDEVYS